MNQRNVFSRKGMYNMFNVRQSYNFELPKVSKATALTSSFDFPNV